MKQRAPKDQLINQTFVIKSLFLYNPSLKPKNKKPLEEDI